MMQNKSVRNIKGLLTLVLVVAFPAVVIAQSLDSRSQAPVMTGYNPTPNVWTNIAPVKGGAQGGERVSQSETKVIKNGTGVWNSYKSGSPRRAEDQSYQERAVVATETAEQLLMTVEFFKTNTGAWPQSLKEATDKARMGLLPIVIGLGPWQLGERGSIEAIVLDPELCSALQEEGSAKLASRVGSPSGCAPEMSPIGQLKFVMTQMNPG